MSLASTVLPGLKEFQRRTVEHAYRELYETDPSPRRFLVADEVGLGKTLVARGVIAKAIDRLKADGVKRIDVVYVCSNQVIARQNIARLSVAGEEHAPVLDRVTMLPAHLRDLQDHEVNLIPLTPQTSLDLRSKVGAARERVVLWHLLRGRWGSRYMARTGPRRVLQGPCRTLASFDGQLRASPYWDWSQDELDPWLSRRFLDALEADDAERGDGSLAARFTELAARMTRRRTGALATEANALVGELRRTLARTCIEALEPDLIVLDEFQRFRDLLSPDHPAGELARMLFAQQDARVLLLSATPYRMLTRDAEATQDHHEDFLHTVGFLTRHDDRAVAQCRQTLASLRAGLRELPEGRARAVEAKAELEEQLRPVMCRTERLAVGGDRNGMVRPVEPAGLELTKADVESFAALDGVARALAQADTVEYWKSCPYPLNFMDDYVLARSYENAAPKRADARLRRGRLRTKAVLAFGRVDLGNARMRALAHDTLESRIVEAPLATAVVPVPRPGGSVRRARRRRPYQAPRVLRLERRAEDRCAASQL